MACLKSNGACDLAPFGIDASQPYAEALHGLRYPAAPLPAGPKCATSFPHAQLLAASFNRSLWLHIGSAISDEARAFFNLYQAKQPASRHALSFWAPDINLCRDPRWGRCLEVPGEDPMLTGLYGAHYVAGMQEVSENRHKVLCNLKHFSAYDVENGVLPGGESYSRGSFDARVPARDLVETYLAHFRTTTLAASPGGVMCSYNAVNGTPSCANAYLNNAVLRGAFNMTGLIVSDCSAINGIQNSHHYTQDPDSTCRVSLEAGVDLNCGDFWADNMAAAVAHGQVTEAALDAALTPVLKQLFDVGLADPHMPAAWAGLGAQQINDPAKQMLARQAATEGMVLLKNEGGVLPIRRGSRIAVLGPHFNSSTYLLANYYGDNVQVDSHTPLLALQRRPEITVSGAAAGCEFAGNDTSGIPAAAKLAEQADVAVVFLGLHSMQGPQVNRTPALEREGWDRHNITLPDIQQQLVQAVAASGTPTVVVLINSGGLAAEWVYAHIPAVLEAYYPGEQGGDALAALLLGDVSPAGRLTTTIYAADLVAQRNITDMVMRPHGDGIPGITYRFLAFDDPLVLFPFGFGRSYTTFAFRLAGAATLVTTTDQLAALWQPFYLPAGAGRQRMLALPPVTVTNTGHATSAVAVLGFAQPADNSNSDAPLQRLFDFERLAPLAPGSQQSVVLRLPPQALTTVDEHGTESLEPGVFHLLVGGAPDGFAHITLQVKGAAKVVFELP